MGLQVRISLATIFCLVFLSGCKTDTETPDLRAGVADENIDYDRKTQSARDEAWTPEEQLAGFTVPEGFSVELVASERDGMVNPIDLTFDDAGRLWTQTAVMYPLDPVSDLAWNDLLALMEDPDAQAENPAFQRTLQLFRGEIEGEDKIFVLSDFYGDNKVHVQTWAEGMAIPQSMLPYKNGAFVAQGSEYFFLEDSDGDGKADKRTPLLTGFGITDTHTMTHTLIRGPGGWIHFSHGALNKGQVRSLVSGDSERMDYSKIARVSLDGSEIELLNAGLNNIWGFQLRANGQWYATEANDLGYSVVPLEPGAAFPGIGNERLRPYQPWMPRLHAFRVGGTGISALAFADDSAGSFPDAWKDVAILANPITSRLNAVRIVREPDGSVTAEHLPDLLRSKDDWFRPVNMEFGPDGCLYIADWYNKIISHNELPTTHPDRDRSHGRIWRICYDAQGRSAANQIFGEGGVPDFYEMPTAELPGYLTSPSFWARQAAWHQISDRPRTETGSLIPQLVTLAEDEDLEEPYRIAALWSLESLGHYEKELWAGLLASPHPDLRREAARSLASFNLDAEDFAAALKPLIVDVNAMVRSQAIRTLEEAGTANPETIDLLVTACRPALEGNSMGGAYERSLERYLARKALETYPEALSSYLRSPLAADQPVDNRIWAAQALPPGARERVFVELWKGKDDKRLDEPTFILIARMLDDPEVYETVRPVLEDTLAAEAHLRYALDNLGQVQSPELAGLLEKPVRSLMEGKDSELQQLGLEAVAKLHIEGAQEAVAMLIELETDPERLRLGLAALQSRPLAHVALFTRIANDYTLPLDLRTYALNMLVRSDVPEAKATIASWLPGLAEDQKRGLTNTLSSSREGAAVLRSLYAEKELSDEAFDLASAERVYLADEGQEAGKALFTAVKDREENARKAFDAKLDRFMAVAARREGNAAAGEKLFQTCLQCHPVGNRGVAFAPALDGSAEREDEALLTALLDPDAAVESSYAVYRVTKKDDSLVEGFLVSQDERGTTLGMMGGSEVFVPSSEIRNQGFIPGRSFMLKGLIDHYSDQQVADLLAYIRTLK